MNFEAIESELIDSIFNKTSELLFGEEDRNRTGDEDLTVGTTEDPLFQDTFFHPDLIEDDGTCKVILYTGLGNSQVRVWDLIILIPNVLFLLFLLFQLPKSRSKIHSSPSQVVKTFYSFVVGLSLTAAVRSLLSIILNLSNPVHDVTDAIIWEFGAFVFLSIELATGVLVVIENKIRNHQRLITASCTVALLVTILQIYFEIRRPFYGLRVLTTGYQLWSQGGPVFSAVLAGLLSAFSLILLLLTSPPIQEHLKLQTDIKGAILYLTGLTINHSVSCLGSTILSYHVNFGLCLSTLTTYLYYTAFSPFLYICFLKSKFPNTLKSFQFSYSSQHNEIDEEVDGVTDCSSMQTFILDQEDSNVS